jgi:hypothetical protein
MTLTNDDQPPIWAGRADDRADDGSPLPPVALDAPPTSVADHDLDAELASPPPSRRALLLTKVLVVGLVAAGAFAAGGWFAHRNAASTPAGFALPAGIGASGFPGFPGGAGGASGGASGSAGTAASSTPAVSGKVTVVDGRKVYVTTSSGSVVVVVTGPRTAVTTATPSSVSKLKAGDAVTVQGTTSSDGTLAATSITRKAS